jgi:hypothetical protein
MAPGSPITISPASLESQLHDPNGTKDPLFFGFIIPLYIIMVPIFFARMYTRTFPVSRLWWDDLFIAVAFVRKPAIVTWSSQV